jgi:hypothetical protein
VLRRADRRLRTARTPDEILGAFERFTVEIAPLNERPAASLAGSLLPPPDLGGAGNATAVRFGGAALGQPPQDAA